MDLILNNWEDSDIIDLNNYLFTLKQHNDINREVKIINTKMNYIGIKNSELKIIASKIYKGNYISYLDKENFKYYENTLIYAYILNKISDFNIFKKYLEIYKNVLDNWASVDAVSPNVKGDKLFALAKNYVSTKNEFIQRLGLRLLFKLIDDKYLNDIYLILNSLKYEEKYYVNMIASWLLCELFIKKRDETILYYETNDTNKFIINKSILKCFDSYRVNNQDKDLLKKYKI